MRREVVTMNKVRIILTLVVVGFLAGSVMACAGSRTSESTGEYVDDSVISNKVRAQLAGDKDLNVFQIDVTTFKGDVQLSGFVNSTEKKDKAGAVAASVSGVKQVHNNLIVK
jgi:osmotically-inducible protein OsmY